MRKKIFIFSPVLILLAILQILKVNAAETTAAVNLKPEKRKIETGIDLKNRLEKDMQQFMKPNLHMVFNCKTCHPKDQKTDKIQRKKIIEIPDDIKLYICLTEANEIKMCAVCHTEKCFHPAGIKPKESDPSMIIPDNLPLGKNKSDGLLVCSTCHNIHAEYSADQLLRGFREFPGQETTLYKKREEFCFSCHKSDLDNYDKPVSIIKHIHESKRPDNLPYKIACKFCHLQNDPEDAVNIQDPLLRKSYAENNLRASVTNICRYCHGENNNKIHYLDINPFADDYLETSGINLSMLLVNNKFTCIICHDPHNKEKKRYHLRKQYIQLGEKSRRISPHKKTDFCLSCHEINKDKNNNDVISNRFNGDWEKICNWCHQTKEARAETHPVNIALIESTYMRKPKEFPLTKEGKIDCLTCHFAGNYGCPENKKYSVYKQELEGNINRLRGWPYPGSTYEERRWYVCLKCHIREGLEKFNVHYQIDRKTKKIIESTCMFCHSSRPDLEIEGLRKPEFKIPVKFLCVSCHYKNAHSGSSEEDGMEYHKYKLREVPGKIIIPYQIHISEKDGIHCATCHNPHQDGLIGKKGALIKGEERKRFPLCSDCHIDRK